MHETARQADGPNQLGKYPGRWGKRPLLRVHTPDRNAEIAGRVDALLQRIHDRTAVVGMVGLGYVGSSWLYPVNQQIMSSTSAFVRPFFSALATYAG